MNKTHNSYTSNAAMLVCCSLALSTSNPPFYLDIVLTLIATIYAVIGCQKGETVN